MMKSLLYLANLRLPTEKAYGIQIAQMCEAFAESGIRVRLVYPRRRSVIREGVHAYYSVHSVFEAIRLWAPDFYLPGRGDRYAVRMKNAISAFILAAYALFSKADVIYSRDEEPLYLLSFFKANLVFEAHRFASRRMAFYRRLLKRGSKIVAISEGVRRMFIRIGFSPDCVLVAHDGVDLRTFSIEQSKSQCRKMLHLPEDKIVVLYAGHLYDWKGASTLAQAAGYLDDGYLTVFVGGTEPDVLKYREAFAEARNVTFLGWRPHAEIPYYLKAADVVVLPNSGRESVSHSYTSPLKLFEYMASGTPIIASDLPVIREVLSETNAMLVKSDDSELLANAIRNLILNASEARTRALQARRDAEQYSWSRRATRILSYL